VFPVGTIFSNLTVRGERAGVCGGTHGIGVGELGQIRFGRGTCRVEPDGAEDGPTGSSKGPRFELTLPAMSIAVDARSR